MDIACPNCAATYRVPDSLLASGKALRCAACDHEWVPGVATPSQEVPPPGPAPVMAQSAVEADLPAPALEGPSTAAPTPDAPVTKADATRPPAAEDPVPEPALQASRPGPARGASPTVPPPLQRRPGPARAPTRRGRGRALPLAWLASVTLVLLGLLALMVFGEDIAMAWPPFARVTALLNG